MKGYDERYNKNNEGLPEKKEKILLMLLPFSDPQIPPLGVSCLKSFLVKNGYPVKNYDANVEMGFRQIYDKYFGILSGIVPEDKKGNFYSIGLDVLQNHMTAHLNYDDEKDYIRLVKILVYKTYYTGINDDQVNQLNQLLDLFYQRLENYLLECLGREKPDVLGLSVCSCTLSSSLFAFKLAKEKYPGIKTVMGGGIFADELASTAYNLEYFLEQTPYIDKLIVGEGEVLFLKLLQGRLPENQRIYTIRDIDGEIMDVSSAAVPDFSDFNLEFYPFMAYYGSRGCPFRCSFCSVDAQWGRFRKKSPRQIVKELSQLYRQYGTQLFLMVDSLLNPFTTALSKAFLESDICLYWDGSLRADKNVCDIENTILWRRGGFYRAHLGIESGAPHVLELMRKDISPDQIKTAVSSLAFAGIKTTTFWIVGYPGETEADFQQTLDLIEELKDDLYECIPRPYLYYKHVNEKEKSILLYPGEAKDKLIVQTWIRDCDPPREVVYQRLNRFTRHIEALGIPNPYSWHEINKADLRWQALHENAVPSLIEFKEKGSYIDECRRIEKLCVLEETIQDDDDFGI